MNELEVLLQSIKSLTDIDEETLTDEMMSTIMDNLDENFSPAIIAQSINQIIKNLDDQGLNKTEAKEAMQTLKDTLSELIYGEEQYTGNKKVLVDTIVNKLNGIFEAAVEKFHSYAIELPMTVDEASGAKVPTYAHDTDAAADLYAMKTTVLDGNSLGNKIRTGVKIQLPEGWLALIIPRSSIGAKTSLRLSNSVGLIDSGYRGELGVLYDNISDTPYTINAGDRIAQLLVMPSYRFQAKVVDILADSDRGEGGFGSSGQ
jgi:dUTP pyrophosphatase